MTHTNRAFTKVGSPGRGYIGLTFPSDIGRALREGGYTHYSIFLTDDGLLIKPTRGAVEPKLPVVELPEWDA